MKFMPRATTRRSTSRARGGSSGSPQISGPVRRIAPKPSLTTSRSPRRMVGWPAAKAPLSGPLGFVMAGQNSRPDTAQKGREGGRGLAPPTLFATLSRSPHFALFRGVAGVSEPANLVEDFMRKAFVVALACTLGSAAALGCEDKSAPPTPAPTASAAAATPT